MYVAVFATVGLCQVATAAFITTRAVTTGATKGAVSIVDNSSGAVLHRTGSDGRNWKDSGLSHQAFFYKYDLPSTASGEGASLFKISFASEKQSVGKIKFLGNGTFSLSDVFLKQGSEGSKIPGWYWFRSKGPTPFVMVKDDYVEFDVNWLDYKEAKGKNLESYRLNSGLSHIQLHGSHDPNGGSVSPVPEPLTAGLMLSGMACSALVLRRRRK